MGSWIDSPRADGGRHGLLDEIRRGRAGTMGGFLDGAPFHRGDRRRDAYQHPGPIDPRHAATLEEKADHALGDVEVGDGPLTQRPHRDDVAGRAADHLPCVLTDGQDVLGPGVQGDDGRLVQDDSLAPCVYERVRRAEVDGEISSHFAPGTWAPWYGPTQRAAIWPRSAATSFSRNPQVASSLMDMGNLFAGGDTPENDDLGEDGLHRGWVSPDDRLWRHPSEVTRLGQPRPLDPLESRTGRPRWRRSGRPVLTAGVVGAAAVAATMVIVLTVVDTPAGPDSASTPFATDTSMVTGFAEPSAAADTPAVPTGQAIVNMVSALKPSMVELQPAGTHGPPSSSPEWSCRAAIS